MLLDNISLATAALAFSVPAVLLLLQTLLLPKLDPSEPPFLKPRIPFMGHVLSMFLEKASFYRRL
jgi:hypothetical protein